MAQFFDITFKVIKRLNEWSSSLGEVIEELERGKLKVGYEYNSNKPVQEMVNEHLDFQELASHLKKAKEVLDRSENKIQIHCNCCRLIDSVTNTIDLETDESKKAELKVLSDLLGNLIKD